MRRLAVTDRNGTIYRDKQECLDYIDLLESVQAPIHGIEVVKLTRLQAESNLYKIIWFKNQDDVYQKSRDFIREQMVGIWNYAEFKS
ncbi:MAG: hypothetical protein K1X54_03200 [Flavobacteriales bacterium]|nr:hypothetical protein [Flavobacteriales bacterium]